MDPSEQVREPRLEVCLVVRACHPIHARSGLTPERVECHSQRILVDVVKERGEPFLLLLPRGVPTGFLLLPRGLPTRSSPVAGWLPRSSVRVTRSRSCARCVRCWSAFPSAPAHRSLDTATGLPALFIGSLAHPTRSLCTLRGRRRRRTRATLITWRALPLTRAGLPPAGTCQLPGAPVLILREPLAFPVILRLEGRIGSRAPVRKCGTIQGCAGLE